MLSYLTRRLLYAIPILFAVNLLTFCLFFMVNSPDDIARAHLGNKHIKSDSILQWQRQYGYDKPLFYNAKATGGQQFTQTLFFQKSLLLFSFNFGVSDSGRDISDDIEQRMGPSLALAIPVLLVSLAVNIAVALLMAFFRATYIDLWGVMICVIMMSISGLFYIIGGQYLLGKMLRLTPISGYLPGMQSLRFIILPVLVSVVSGIGSGARWYRAIFLEEIERDYVKTAYAKGCSEVVVMLRHVLRNALIPIITGVVVIIPTLFMGSLLLESFFAVPGLGSYTIDAIQQQDFAIVRVMVFIGTVLYIVGLILTDVCYGLVDPRIRLS